jgi:hypothetical protein
MEPILEELPFNKAVRKFLLVAVCVGADALVVFLFFPWLEWGLLNFGDSDLPPFQPDTLFEKCVDAAWLAAALLLVGLVVYCFKCGVDLILSARNRRHSRTNFQTK